VADHPALLVDLDPQGNATMGSGIHKEKVDLSIADVIFVYGRKKTMQKFEDFAYKKAKKGTRIVVNTNRFPNKKPLKSNNGIFLYRA